jgi:O-antigen/teichoic acid export membrane protein
MQQNNISLKKVAFKNFSWLAAEKVIRLISGIVSTSYLARILGVGQFGEISFITTVVLLFQSFSTLGIGQIITRDLSNGKYSRFDSLRTAAIIRIISSIVTYVILLISSKFYLKNNTALLELYAIGGLLIVVTSFDFVDYLIQADCKNKVGSIFKSIALIISTSLKIIFVLFGFDLKYIIATLPLEAMIWLLLAHYFIKIPPPIHSGEKIINNIRRVLNESWPIFLAGMLSLLLMKSSIFFLRYFSDYSSVGVYVAGTQLAESWYFISMSISTAAGPILVRKHTVSETAFNSALSRLFKYSWVMCSIVILFSLPLAKPAIEIIYGKGFSTSYYVYSIHIFSLIPVTVGVIQSIWIICKNKTKLFIIQSLAGLIINITFNILLTPSYGPLGATISTISAQFFQVFVVIWFLEPNLSKLQFSIFTSKIINS